MTDETKQTPILVSIVGATLLISGCLLAMYAVKKALTDK